MHHRPLPCPCRPIAKKVLSAQFSQESSSMLNVYRPLPCPCRPIFINWDGQVWVSFLKLKPTKFTLKLKTPIFPPFPSLSFTLLLDRRRCWPCCSSTQSPNAATPLTSASRFHYQNSTFDHHTFKQAGVGRQHRHQVPKVFRSGESLRPFEVQFEVLSLICQSLSMSVREINVYPEVQFDLSYLTPTIWRHLKKKLWEKSILW